MVTKIEEGGGTKFGREKEIRRLEWTGMEVGEASMVVVTSLSAENFGAGQKNRDRANSSKIPEIFVPAQKRGDLNVVGGWC